MQLKKDIAELEELQKQTTRQKVKDILSIEQRKLIAEVTKLEEQYNNSISASATPTPGTRKCYQVKLNNYGKLTNIRGR